MSLISVLRSNPTEPTDFLTVQSLTNFAAMAGAITAAWASLATWKPDRFSGIETPYYLAFAFGIVSVVLSWEALKKANGDRDYGKVLAAVFIGFVNALVLAGAVVGTKEAAGILLR